DVRAGGIDGECGADVGDLTVRQVEGEVAAGQRPGAAQIAARQCLPGGIQLIGNDLGVGGGCRSESQWNSNCSSECHAESSLKSRAAYAAATGTAVGQADGQHGQFAEPGGG